MGRETNKQRRERAAGSAREKAAAARAVQQRADQRRRALVVLSSVVAVAVVAVIIVVVALGSSSSDNGAGNRTTAAPAVVAAVTSVPAATFATVGSGTSELALTKVSKPPLSAAKPDLLYIGGEFCPFCAAERWSLAVALSRFGTFKDLSQIRSAADDGDIATLSFYKSSYRSKYLTFSPVEHLDRDSKPLESLTSAQQAAYTAVTGQTQLGYPFLDYNGVYAQNAEGFDGQGVLGTKSQTQIAAALADPSDPITKGIVGEANNITAALCGMTENQPTAVCSSPVVATIQAKIPAASA